MIKIMLKRGEDRNQITPEEERYMPKLIPIEIYYPDVWEEAIKIIENL